MQVLEQAEGAVAALGELPLAGMHPADLLDLTQGLFTLADRLDAVIQRAIEQMHWTGASWDAANLGPRRWMTQQCRRPAGEATSRIKVAERIVDHPNCAAAHAEGRVNLAQLRIITTTLKNLPEADRDTAEQILLRAAEHVDPNELARLARELEAVVAPEREEDRAARRYRSRYLTVATTFAGMVHINGLLDPETGAALHAALAPLTAPQGEDDPRSAGQRRADALGALARHALASDQLPNINGSKPVVHVTIDWHTLHSGIGTGSIGSPGHDLPLDAGTIRRLACDASILPVVLGGPSGVLDIGRASKTWPLAIRRAAALRDQGCTFPGCRAPITFCELHHIIWWMLGGPTSLFNSTHLCLRHHHTVHQEGWTITRHPDGTLTFTNPPGHTSTWHPPATLSDFLPASDTPAAPAIPLPVGSGPDIACQTSSRHITTIRIPPPPPGHRTPPASPAKRVRESADFDPTLARTSQVANQAFGIRPQTCRWIDFRHQPGKAQRHRVGRKPTSGSCRAARPPPDSAQSATTTAASLLRLQRHGQITTVRSTKRPHPWPNLHDVETGVAVCVIDLTAGHIECRL